ncbi:MAG: hypothetical protein WB421_04165 [Terriglobales bacterium]|jgi:hypothetical protein
MLPLDYLRNYLRITPHFLQAVLLVLLVRRASYRQFPIFVSYTGFEVLQFAVLLAMRYSSSVSGGEYYYTYALGSAISAGLRFGVIYEVFTHVFRDYPALSGFGRTMFRWAAVVLLLLALGLAWLAPAEGIGHLMVMVDVLNRSVSILQCGLLLFLFLFSGYFALSWQSYAFGIALGLGIYASMDIAIASIRSQIEPRGAELLDGIIMATYHACVLIWLFYLLVPCPETRHVLKSLPEHDLETWNQELQRLIQK